MDKFKITIEYSGKDDITIDNGSGIFKTTTIDKMVRELPDDVQWVVLNTICNLDKEEKANIERDLSLLGYNPSILSRHWALKDYDADWILYDVLTNILTNNFENSWLLTDAANDNYMDVVMNVCVLHNHNRIAFGIMLKYIFKTAYTIGEFIDIFDKTYRAAAISDNVRMFETLKSFSIQYKDVDNYLFEAAKNNSENVINFILFGNDEPSDNDKPSKIALDMALKEASKNKNNNIIDALHAYGDSLIDIK